MQSTTVSPFLKSAITCITVRKWPSVPAQLVLQNSPMDEIETVLGFCQRVGLPVTLAQMGVKEGIDEKIAAVAKATCAEGETIHNMPFAVTPESVHAAILTADLLGQQWLAR